MQVHIVHTNDVHSHLGTYSNIINYINTKKQYFNHQAIYVDIGDHVDRMHPFTEATLGKGNVELLNEAHCDVATIGNNEGITLSKKELTHLYDNANFEVVCVNVRDENGLLFKPYTIKEINKIKIGFLGATVEFTPFYHALGWRVEGAFDYIASYLDEMKSQCDVIIMLSHLGRYDDVRLAEAFPEIDVVIGGHTHHAFEKGEYVNDTLLAAAGRFGEYVGDIVLTFEDSTLVKKEATLIDSETLVRAESNYFNEGKEMLEAYTIKEHAKPIQRTLFTMNEFSYHLLQMIKDFTNSDVQLINAGLIASEFEGGKLTKFNLHRVLPHAINLVKVEVTGRELKEIYTMASLQENKDEVLHGLGFRGDIFGIFLIEGLSVIESTRKYFIGNEEIIDNKVYTVGTLDMYTFGRFFPPFKSAKKEYYMPEFLREIVWMYKEML